MPELLLWNPAGEQATNLTSLGEGDVCPLPPYKQSSPAMVLLIFAPALDRHQLSRSLCVRTKYPSRWLWIQRSRASPVSPTCVAHHLEALSPPQNTSSLHFPALRYASVWTDHQAVNNSSSLGEATEEGFEWSCRVNTWQTLLICEFSSIGSLCWISPVICPSSNLVAKNMETIKLNFGKLVSIPWDVAKDKQETEIDNSSALPEFRYKLLHKFAKPE